MTDTIAATDRSPFLGQKRTPARRVAGYVVAFAVIAGAAVAAYMLTREVPDESTPVSAHVHAAPGTTAGGPVTLDPEAARRIGVTFATAEAGPMVAEVTSVGQVTYDETRATAIAPKVDGWVEKLYVNFTGQNVREGEPLFALYSPMLVTAQEELLLAARLVRDVVNGSEETRRNASEMLVSARRRLQYIDVSSAEIERIEQTGQVSRTITLRSPSRGVVVEKMVLEGQRIMAGETVYRLADLREVWVEGEIFENNVASIRMGQRASIEVQAYPGEQWHGTVSYVYPTVDPSTRTARVRIALANAGQRLKPGMYATVHLTTTRGRVLSVPRSAVVTTGERTIVFVRAPDGQLAPRDVVTGSANGDRVEIVSGLKEGDTVVASATFLIDAESNMKSALDAMSGMPGMGTKAPPAPAPSRRDTMADMPGMKPPAPSGMDHSQHQAKPAGEPVRAPRGRGE
jgi:membrane fusion protein, copper/silver efflux system